MAKRTFYSIGLLVLSMVFTSLRAQDIITASLNTPANAGILSESCSGPYALVIERGATTDTILIFISDIGEALSNTDYNFPPGSFPITMLPEDTVAIIPIDVITDALPEGFETLGWEIAYLAGEESGFITLESGITDQYDVEILTSGDTIQWCRYAPLQLTASSTATIQWSPSFSFDPSTGAEVTVRPFLSGWYFATVGSDTCGAKDSIYLDLAIAEIDSPDTIFICLDEQGAVLPGSIDGLATNFEWIPADSTLSNPNILTPVANPTITATYILQSDFGVCIAADTVTVRVDSLPQDMHIDIAPMKPYYCAGEIVALFSPAYDSLDFPDITFGWGPRNNTTFLSDTTILNAALQLQDTTLYIRNNYNNACLSKDSILINVIPPSVPLSVTDTTLCPGEMFTVVVLSDQVNEPEWTPETGLSCTQCLDPTVTVTGAPGTTVSYQFSGNINDCPVGALLPITIPGLQQIGIAGDNIACEGDMIPLTITNPEGLSNLHWTIDEGDASLSCTNCTNPVVTISGMETVKLIVIADTDNPNFCGAEGFFNILPGEQPQVQGPEFIACLGGTVVVSTGNINYTDVEWTVIGGDLSLSCTSCDNPTVTVNSTGTLRFFAEVSGPDTCRVSGTVAVIVFPGDGASLSVTEPAPPTPIGQGEEVTVVLGVNPIPTSITWVVNGVQISGSTNIIMFNAEDEVNFVEVTFINSNGCVEVDTLSIATVPPSFQIPNAFTPNSDMINDEFEIIIIGNIVVEEFSIYNRWGQKVFDVTDGNSSGWDGRFKDEPAASDTYVYTATLLFPDGRRQLAKGDVMLLR
jgi:gliding motility-associated-like protein